MSYEIPRADVSPEMRRRAYVKKAYEDGYEDGRFGKLRAVASYFTNGDEEAIGAYGRGLRIGRQQRERLN